MLMTIHTVYIALGSNLCNPIQQVDNALRSLKTLPKTRLETHSSLYRTAPLGPQNQPDYINAVAVLNTQLTPNVLLSRLQQIERKQGRIRTAQRWGPRTLDLDILLYDNVQSKNSRLTLPHPGLQDRAFVLYPLFECAPALVLPDGKKLSELIIHSSTRGLQKLEVRLPACQKQKIMSNCQ